MWDDDWDADSCGFIDGNYDCIAGYTFNSNYKLWISITKRFSFQVIKLRMIKLFSRMENVNMSTL